MADISGYIRIINEAEKGEAVRDAITGALEEMNTYGGNASTLENHPASYFATATFFTAVAEQVGEVDDVLIAIENGLNALKYDMGEFTLSGSGGSFTVDCTGIKGYDNLDVSKFYFEILGGSDATQAGNWTPTQSYNPETGVFSYSWGALSSNINVRLWIVKPTHTTVGVQVQPLVITENGNWDAGANAAYNPVTIRVPNVIDVRKLTQSITRNGVFTFTPEPNTGFSEVTLHIEVPMPREKVIINQTFTENGTYRAIDEEPAADGYGIVTVNVNPKVLIDEKTITQNGTWQAIDEGADAVKKVIVDVDPEAVLGHKTIGQNGTYNAEDDDLDGYSSVNVVVPEKELHEKTITENGIYDPLTEIPAYDGYSKVRVFVSGGGSYPVQSVKYLFSYNRYNYEFFPMVLSLFGTSEVTDFQYLFDSNTVNDGDIDLTGLDTSAATKLRNLFNNSKCDTLTFDSHIFDGPLSEGNPVQEMFYGSTIGKVIFGTCKFPKSSGYMFRYAGVCEIEMHGSDLSDIGNNNDDYSNEQMFYGVGGDFIAMVNGCVGQIFYQIKRAMFYRAAFSSLKGSLTGGKAFGKVKDGSYMFQDYRGNIDNLDPTIFDYSECTSMYQMFDGINNSSVSGTELKLSFKNVSLPLCTDARYVVNGSQCIRKLEFDGLSLAIAIDVRSLLRASYARIITATGMNLPSARCLDSFLGDVYRARFIDINGITVGSGAITDCEGFIRDNGFNENSAFTKTFTAEVGTNTVVLSVGDDEKNWLWYEGRDDGYNYVTYFVMHPDVTINDVEFDYIAKTLTVEYTNSGESDISTRLVVTPNQHMFLPKSFDCTGITNSNYRPFYNTLTFACMDLYTDGTKQEIAALNWFNAVDSGGWGDGSIMGEIHYEISHAEFLALPEVVYNGYLKRYGYFTIVEESMREGKGITYTLSQDGMELTAEIEADADNIGFTFYVGFSANTKINFQSSSTPYVQCGTCRAFSNAHNVIMRGSNRGDWREKSRGGAAMNYTVQNSDYNPKYFATCGNGNQTEETVTIVITIVTD